MREKRTKYCYCMGEMEYFPNEDFYEFAEILKEVEEVRLGIIKRIEKAKRNKDKQLVEDILFNTNPIEIFSTLVTYENNCPIYDDIIKCVKTIKIEDKA